MQAAARGRVERARVAEKKREHSAAVSLQAVSRGHKARAEQRSVVRRARRMTRARVVRRSVVRRARGMMTCARGVTTRARAEW
eukprot:6216315-Prymnesium_polylepis.1